MKIAALLLLAWVVAADAVTIYPNVVTISGKAGTSKAINFKVYGHKSSVPIEIVKATDLRSVDDKVLTKFILGAEQQRVVPMNIAIKENTQYYLCAVRAKSESMRLRTCAQIVVKVTP